MSWYFVKVWIVVFLSQWDTVDTTRPIMPIDTTKFQRECFSEGWWRWWWRVCVQVSLGVVNCGVFGDLASYIPPQFQQAFLLSHDADNRVLSDQSIENICCLVQNSSSSENDQDCHTNTNVQNDIRLLLVGIQSSRCFSHQTLFHRIRNAHFLNRLDLKKKLFHKNTKNDHEAVVVCWCWIEYH